MARFGVLTGGGDCPGLNAVIRAIVRRGNQLGHEFFGYRYGWAGVLAGDGAELTAEATRGILHRGGTILGTSRTNPYKEENGLERVKASMAQHNLDGLIPIGGEDTLGVAGRLSEDGIDVVGVPKTIDNDLAGTDFTFGFQTAVQIATDAIDRLHTTAESHNRVIVVEVMGRTAGWIACYSGMAGGADVILVPERPFDIEEVCERVRHRHESGHSFSIVVVAEGATPKDGEVKSEFGGGTDAFGHVRLGGIAVHLEREIEERTGFESRMTILGHVQRGGTPLAYDRVLGTRFGVAAIDAADQGDFGKMVALRGTEIELVSLDEALAEPKLLDPRLYETADGVLRSSVQAVFKQGPIPAFVHGVVEYLAAILFIAAPFIFDFDEDAAVALSLIVGVLILIIAASTHWRTGLIQLDPRAGARDARLRAGDLPDRLAVHPRLLRRRDRRGVLHRDRRRAPAAHDRDALRRRGAAAARSGRQAPRSRVRGDRRTRRGGRGRLGRGRGCRRCSTPRRRSRGRWRARA